MSRKMRPRIGIDQIDAARRILASAVKESEVDYDKLSEEYAQAQGIEFEFESDRTKYFFKVISKSPGGIYFPRLVSDKLTTEQLQCGQKIIGSQKFTDEVAQEVKEEVGISEASWDDFYVGYNPANARTRAKKGKNKRYTDCIENVENLADSIVEMKTSLNKKNSEILTFLNELVQSGEIPGIESDETLDNTFLMHFYNHKGIEKKKRLSKTEKEARLETIKSMTQEGKSDDEILDYLEENHGTKWKKSSLNQERLKHGIKKANSRNRYKVEELSDEIRDYISLKYGREGLALNRVRDGLSQKFDYDIPHHGIQKIVNDLGLQKGKPEFTHEQIAWLKEHAPTCISQEQIAEDFNEKFETDYEKESLLNLEVA